MNNTIYTRLDVDNAGDSIELALLKSNHKKAQKTHNLIQENINYILNKIKSINTFTILMKGCDDILISTKEENHNLIFWEELRDEFKIKTGFTLSIGIGYSINESMINLRIAKVSGKDKIVKNNNI